jgi:hypothetical protein
MDTDYYVLFADLPNVDVSDIRGGKIYNPNKCWKNLIPAYIYTKYPAYECGPEYEPLIDVTDRQLYNIVVRLSPLLGNDYTTHSPIIAAKNFQDYITLLSEDVTKLRSNNRKTIGKVLNASATGFKRKGKITSLDEIDDLIHRYNPGYFKSYLLSTIVYLNWHQYGHYQIPNVFTEDRESELTYELMTSISNDLNKDGKSVPCYVVWDPELMFTDPESFVESLGCVESSIESLIDQYVDFAQSTDGVYTGADDGAVYEEAEPIIFYGETEPGFIDE